MKKYYFTNPSEKSAKWHGYGMPLATVRTQAQKVATESGKSVPVCYEDITASGTVRETGDALVCHPDAKGAA